MRLNKFIADNTALSRRAADKAIEDGRVVVGGLVAMPTTAINDTDIVELDGKDIHATNKKSILVLLKKPVGYVCSKDGQGSPTLYDMLPNKYQSLNIAGRLDKDSSGLVALTNNGEFLNKLTHPKYDKTKVYEIELNKALAKPDYELIHQRGVELEDGISRLDLMRLGQKDNKHWQVSMHQGRNRQIRRTFEALGYKVYKLNRTKIADYSIIDLQNRNYIEFDI